MTPAASPPVDPAEIEIVRAFSRFYTQRVGALAAHFLDSPFTLPEVRVMFEIARAERPLARGLRETLGMDAGHLSRMLARFEARGLIARSRGEGDARQRPIVLTTEGQAVFADLDRRQRDAVVAMLTGLAPGDRRIATDALAEAQALLGGRRSPWTIRTFRAGDMGAIAARQAILYDAGWGWGRPMEVLLGEVTTGFLRDFRPGREQCWIGEIDGRMAGSIFCADGGAPGLAKVRLLYVEDFARGMGLGEALVDHCLRFARDAGYDRIELWTHTILTSARRIYAAKGFVLTETAMHRAFGEPVQGETWRLAL